MSSEIELNSKRYVVGLVRDPIPESDKKHSHLYDGTYADPGRPLCRYGWNRKEFGWSIWRGQYGKGICKICKKRAEKGLTGIDNPFE